MQSPTGGEGGGEGGGGASKSPGGGGGWGGGEGGPTRRRLAGDRPQTTSAGGDKGGRAEETRGRRRGPEGRSVGGSVGGGRKAHCRPMLRRHAPPRGWARRHPGRGGAVDFGTHRLATPLVERRRDGARPADELGCQEIPRARAQSSEPSRPVADASWVGWGVVSCALSRGDMAAPAIPRQRRAGKEARHSTST